MWLRQRSNLDSSKVPRHHQHAHALGGELKDEDFIFESPTVLAALFRNDSKLIRVVSPLRAQSSSHNQIWSPLGSFKWVSPPRIKHQSVFGFKSDTAVIGSLRYQDGDGHENVA